MTFDISKALKELGRFIAKVISFVLCPIYWTYRAVYFILDNVNFDNSPVDKEVPLEVKVKSDVSTEIKQPETKQTLRRESPKNNKKNVFFMKSKKRNIEPSPMSKPIAPEVRESTPSSIHINRSSGHPIRPVSRYKLPDVPIINEPFVSGSPLNMDPRPFQRPSTEAKESSGSKVYDPEDWESYEDYLDYRAGINRLEELNRKKRIALNKHLDALELEQANGGNLP